MPSEAEVHELIAKAKAALALTGSPELELFVARTGEYLDALEQWQQAMAQQNPLVEPSALTPEAKESFRRSVEALNQVHQELMDRAGAAKEEVGQQMGEVHRRASGLRKYIDSGPSRITITGKRKG
ncbi:MAG: hypothetical protein KDD69_02135 [Bdellovibrionales bacterium]|nr:hypothetical protein [Bdellovibrionales bacterium]